MTDDERHALTEAVLTLRRAAEKLREVARRSAEIAAAYSQCADRVDSLGQLDTESSEALAEAVKLLGDT